MPSSAAKPRLTAGAPDIVAGFARAALGTRKPRTPRKGKPIPNDDAFARVFAALGESTRLRIMQLLPREPICQEMYNVVDLADELGLKQPTISHHLKILSEAGLIQGRRQCNSIYYYVDQQAVVGWLKDVRLRFGCEQCGG